MPAEVVPETPDSDSVLVEDVLAADEASEPLEPVDEVISSAGPGNEVPPTFDAPADRPL